ncbi:phage holin family protein [Frigidibacter sp. MR17.24]|uniref:phage holin family protein n=1 Tax=Frigidibacter sp. MR17.24 TaxID=3127345 RepID=UPI003012F69D
MNRERPRGGHRLRDAGGLVGLALEQLGTLVRGELDLLRTEIDRAARQVAVALACLAAALVLLIVALNTLVAASVDGLAQLGLDPGWAALIVGAALTLVALAMATKGWRGLRLVSLAPARSFRSLRADVETLRKEP